MNDEDYLEYYRPLLRAFVDEVAPLPHPAVEFKMPEPHLPLFGNQYTSSALKMVIVGQDTKTWGNLREFLTNEQLNPGCHLAGGLAEFRSRAFTGWGTRRSDFFGFVMMMMAALHGKDNWGLMKRGGMPEILNSFAWAEGNAVEFYSERLCPEGKTPVPREYWERVRQAGVRFNRFSHILETLRPRVALILYRGLDVAEYFKGSRPDGQLPDKINEDGRLIHYRLPEANVDIFHVPHPGNMNRLEGADYFRDRLKELFHEQRITVPYPEFLSSRHEGKELLDHLKATLPDIGENFTKYEFVAQVAEELAKHESFMSVPILAELVNAKGGETDQGCQFEGVRGSYKLVSGTYHRMMHQGRPERAHNVAVGFRKPNFDYAYETD